MIGDVSRAEKIYIVCGYTDMRKGINGLALLIQQNFHLDPFSNSLFLFCGKKADRLKALYYEHDGFILLTNRLDHGSFQWPRNRSEAAELTGQQYRWLMEGLSIKQPKAIRPGEKYALG